MRSHRSGGPRRVPSQSAICAIAGLVSACFSPGEGVEPPRERIYFPVGLTQNTDGTRLFVVNSDFDLQFNAGTLQTYDLPRLSQVVPKVCSSDDDCGEGHRCDLSPSAENAGSPSRFCVAESGAFAGRPCGAFGPRPAGDKLLYPGRCEFIDPSKPQDGGSPLIVDSVTIGAFATDAIYRERPPDTSPGAPARLYVPVRGDATLHWIDVDAEGRLECGQANNSGACDDLHRSGDDPDQENTRDLRLAPEPFGIDAPAASGPIVVTNQTSGTASLFVDDWSTRGPRLEFALTGLPTRPIGVASIPKPALAVERNLDFRPGFFSGTSTTPRPLQSVRSWCRPAPPASRPTRSAPTRAGLRSTRASEGPPSCAAWSSATRRVRPGLATRPC
jgi:hypothetical protein